MKKIKQLILLATLLFATSSCIHEGAEDCIYTLRFKYDYNMDFVDKFAQQAETLHLFVFDENDLFVTQLERSGDELKSSKVEFNLATADHGKEFTFLAWVGIDNYNIISTDPVVGETTLHEMEVALNIESRAQRAFEPLMVGELTTKVQPEKEDVISLIKNTNKFRISLRLDPKLGTSYEPLRADNYNIYIESNNTRYNLRNQIVSDDLMHYYPYYKEETDSGFLVEINTLRIVDGRHNELVIEDAKTQQEQMRIDLNKYLEDLRFSSYRQMPRQEFFDREDEFAIVIFLTNPNASSSFGIEINGWFIRFQEYNGNDL